MSSRENQLSRWLTDLFPKQTLSLQPLPGDASFRRYYRCYHPEGSYIVMDSPPEHNENCPAFVEIDKAFETHKIHVPHIYHQDLEQGFLLLDDFGDTTYYEAFKTQNPHLLYQEAIHTLIQIQRSSATLGINLPAFDADFMMQELLNFDHWFIRQLLGITLKNQERRILDEAYEKLIQSAVSQKQILIHRDYHSRNLMHTPTHSPGILDFQDAMIGPITYDLVSLLKDCYISWPDGMVDTWVDYYFDQAKTAGLLQMTADKTHITETQFFHAFDLMGMQRHLKAIFIFARKYIRDQQPAYLNDIPLVLQYLINASGRYEEFESFHWLLQTVILPKFTYPAETSSFRREMTPRTTVELL